MEGWNQVDSKWKVAPTDRVIWKSPELGKETKTESKADLKKSGTKEA